MSKSSTYRTADYVYHEPANEVAYAKKVVHDLLHWVQQNYFAMATNFDPHIIMQQFVMDMANDELEEEAEEERGTTVAILDKRDPVYAQVLEVMGLPADTEADIVYDKRLPIEEILNTVKSGMVQVDARTFTTPKADPLEVAMARAMLDTFLRGASGG